MKNVTLGPGPHGTMSANWSSEGMRIFDALEPGRKAELVTLATSPRGKPALERIVTGEPAPADTMTLLILALEQHGLEATRAALAQA